MKYQDILLGQKLDPEKCRGAWAFMVGNPWENEAEAESFEHPDNFVVADHLAKLVVEGKKTATTSALADYASDEALPQVDDFYELILDGKGQPVCAIQTTKVYLSQFNQVSAEHAYKEGEGDLSLAYWREVHEAAFKEWGLFEPEMRVVCEEFEVVARF